jgi:hypothetical protein
MEGLRIQMIWIHFLKSLDPGSSNMNPHSTLGKGRAKFLTGSTAYIDGQTYVGIYPWFCDKW